MPFLFDNKIKIITYASLWLLYAIVHVLSMYMLVDVAFGALVIDALLHAVLYAGLGMLLVFVRQYAKYETFTPVQRYFNYGILAVLITGLWTGGGYLGDYLILDETAYAFVCTLPVKGLIGFMIYAIFVLSFHVNQELTSFEEIDRQDFLPDLPISETSEPSAPDSEEILERIAVKNRQDIHLIPLNEIVYLQSYGDYVYVITQTDKYLKEQTMKYFEEHLPKNFVRIHRSYIINIEYIVRIESSGRQTQEVALKTGEWLNMSTVGYKALKSVLKL